MAQQIGVIAGSQGFARFLETTFPAFVSVWIVRTWQPFLHESAKVAKWGAKVPIFGAIQKSQGANHGF